GGPSGLERDLPREADHSLSRVACGMPRGADDAVDLCELLLSLASLASHRRERRSDRCDRANNSQGPEGRREAADTPRRARRRPVERIELLAHALELPAQLRVVRTQRKATLQVAELPPQ